MTLETASRNQTRVSARTINKSRRSNLFADPREWEDGPSELLQTVVIPLAELPTKQPGDVGELGLRASRNSSRLVTTAHELSCKQGVRLGAINKGHQGHLLGHTGGWEGGLSKLLQSV